MLNACRNFTAAHFTDSFAVFALLSAQTVVYYCKITQNCFEKIMEKPSGNLQRNIFQCDFCAVTLFRGGADFSPVAISDCLKLALVVDGWTTVIVEGKSKRLEKDEIAVICPQTLSVIKAENAEYITIDVDLKKANAEIKRFVPFFNVNGGVPAFVTKSDVYYGEIYSAVCALRQVTEQNDCEVAVINALQAVFNSRIQNGQTNVSDAKQLYAVTKILQYIYETAGVVSVKTVANTCGYNEFYTMKLFKQYVGETIVDYSNKCKIYQSAKMLRETRENIRDIAQKVGFENISYFNRQFRRLYGVTPKEYRKLAQTAYTNDIR